MVYLLAYDRFSITAKVNIAVVVAYMVKNKGKRNMN
jgi:hypothetical protein